MTKDMDEKSPFNRYGIIIPLQASEALSGIEKVVQRGVTGVTVMRFDSKGMKNRAVSSSPFLSNLFIQDHKKEAALLDSTSQTDRDNISARLREYVGELLMMDIAEIDVESSFPSLGFDSIMAVQLKNEIEFCYHIVLSPEQFVDANVNKLAEVIWQEKGASEVSNTDMSEDPFKVRSCPT